MTSLLTRTSRARCHIRFGCVTLALVVTLTHNPRWVVTYLLIGWRHYDVMWGFPRGFPNVIKLLPVLNARFLYTNTINPLMGTLKPHSNGPLCSNTVIGTLAVVGWTVTSGTARRGLGLGCSPAQAPHRCTKCNSPPINGQCTNFILFDVAL